MLGPAELIRKRVAMPLSPPRQGESLTTDFLPAANLMHTQETFIRGGISAVAYRSVVDRRYIIAQGGRRRRAKWWPFSVCIRAAEARRHAATRV